MNQSKNCDNKNEINKIKDEKCAICLDDEYTSSGTDIFGICVVLECKHKFHLGCVIGIQNKLICPLCRAPIYFKDVYYGGREFVEKNLSNQNDETQFHMLLKALKFGYTAGTLELTPSTSILDRIREMPSSFSKFIKSYPKTALFVYCFLTFTLFIISCVRIAARLL